LKSLKVKELEWNFSKKHMHMILYSQAGPSRSNFTQHDQFLVKIKLDSIMIEINMNIIIFWGFQVNKFTCHVQELLHIWKDRDGPNIDFNKIPSMIFILFDGILASLFMQHSFHMVKSSSFFLFLFGKEKYSQGTVLVILSIPMNKYW
jgi:hypothetical protein